MRYIRLIVVAVIFGIILTLAISGGYLFWYAHRPLPQALTDEPLFEGITYTRELRDEPRPLVIHVVTIDLDAPGLSFLVTPGNGADGFDYAARTASQFLDEYDLQLVINGDFFDPWRDYGPWDYYPHVDEGVNTRGRTVSQGTFVTDGYSPTYDTMYISADNRITFNTPPDEVYNALSGHLMIVLDSVPQTFPTPNSYLEDAHPRTAIALNESSETMIIVIVDGRQPNYSEGVTIPELADIITDYGGYTALNLDGGGSSVLVIEGTHGQPIQLNSAIHNRIPGRERPLANHLGIYARRSDDS